MPKMVRLNKYLINPEHVSVLEPSDTDTLVSFAGGQVLPIRNMCVDDVAALLFPVSPTTEKPVEKPAAEKPVEKPAAEKPVEKPAAEKTADKPATDKPKEK